MSIVIIENTKKEQNKIRDSSNMYHTLFYFDVVTLLMGILTAKSDHDADVFGCF